MIILEKIFSFFIELFLLDVIGGTFNPISNGIRKLFRLTTLENEDGIKLDKIRNRYHGKKVTIISKTSGVPKGSIGLVTEIIDHKNAFVKFDNFAEPPRCQSEKLL